MKTGFRNTCLVVMCGTLPLGCASNQRDSGMPEAVRVIAMDPNVGVIRHDRIVDTAGYRELVPHPTTDEFGHHGAMVISGSGPATLMGGRVAPVKIATVSSGDQKYVVTLWLTETVSPGFINHSRVDWSGDPIPGTLLRSGMFAGDSEGQLNGAPMRKAAEIHLVFPNVPYSYTILVAYDSSGKLVPLFGPHLETFGGMRTQR